PAPPVRLVFREGNRYPPPLGDRSSLRPLSRRRRWPVMFRSHRLLCCVLAAVVLCPTLAMAQSGVDLIPDDATAALVINSISGIRNTSKKSIKAFESVFKDDFGIRKGIDEKGSAAIVLPRLKKLPQASVLPQLLDPRNDLFFLPKMPILGMELGYVAFPV